MTALLDDPPVVQAPDPVTVSPPPRPPSPTPAPARTTDARRLRRLFAVWLVAVIAGLALVPYGFGPFFHEREQRSLMSRYRAAIERAANESTGLPGVSVPKLPPDIGAPVGILEIGSIKLQLVVVEGAAASQTRDGPGHVAGTAGLGQPGNAVIVGRNRSFGGDFRRLGSVHQGDEIVVTTTQGQSVYEVTTTKKVEIADSISSSESPTDSSASGDTVDVDALYGPSSGDQLTLITSASAKPWNSSDARVVVAKMKSVPFAPTPQGGLSTDVLGTKGERGVAASVILAVVAYGIVLGASVMLYRALSLRSAYLLTVAPIIAITVISAETLSRVFPAWM